ncbi:YcaO-like family protein [Bacillus sp. NTK074B]|uniref:YcaO-like family protein n=1 Tax=Bacillus sp. NTK074B TaxID=2802174 RepID=UPI001A8F12C6|nr:YcaO-like family protein [Bacillus sp. NTK074B]
MYKITKNGTPFLISELRVHRSIFRDAPKKVNITPSSLEGINGGATHFQIDRVLKAALGEHIERTSLYINAGNFKEENIPALNITTMEPSLVPVKNVLLCYYSKLFKEKIDMTVDYNDSCGVASHIHSFPTINSAFLEFFERQSFVHNWLTQSAGRLIDNTTISSPGIVSLMNKASQFVDDIYFFDISIHPKIKVILTLGFGEKYMAMGLSADWVLEKAMISSLEELFQFFGTSANKHFLGPEDIIFKGETYEGNALEDSHFYSNYFFKTYTPQKLKESYAYLFKKSTHSIFTNESYQEKNFMRDVKQLAKELQLDINVVFIPSVIKNIPTKIVKILATNGYPHMFTELIDPYNSILPKVLGQNDFPNQGKSIPFP